MNFTATSPSVVAFVEGVQKVFDSVATDVVGRRAYVTEGARYLKVVAADKACEAAGIPTGAAYCFIDRTDGTLLKTASWSSPAKGSRGNVSSPDALASATPYGFGYRR